MKRLKRFLGLYFERWYSFRRTFYFISVLLALSLSLVLLYSYHFRHSTTSGFRKSPSPAAQKADRSHQ
ncbi:hypothetical protein [Tellurirhabdus bombi]|uniref:hypothetical protein n=1 Tax=Tellurirhabdus bombi TaxID=2907205 RepID=UPI001F3B3080|nr:hypothetical protein [Tellurirhabdus bombi]